MIKKGRRQWIGINWTLSIPELDGIDLPACAVFQLIVKMKIVSPGITHSADRVTRTYPIANLDIPRRRVHELVNKAIAILDGYRSRAPA